MDLNKLQLSLGDSGKKQGITELPPVESWDPPYCGDIGLQIKRSGQWYYQGSPIGRRKLTRLFSTILIKQQDQYFLVTPVEKVLVNVEDVPFVITQWSQTRDGIQVSTQTEDVFILGATHPVELRQDSISNTAIPYVKVRRNLWARVHQNVFYQWAEIAEIKDTGNSLWASVNSGDYTVNLGTVS
jgi:hypothetical protein